MDQITSLCKQYTDLTDQERGVCGYPPAVGQSGGCGYFH